MQPGTRGQQQLPGSCDCALLRAGQGRLSSQQHQWDDAQLLMLLPPPLGATQCALVVFLNSHLFWQLVCLILTFLCSSPVPRALPSCQLRPWAVPQLPPGPVPRALPCWVLPADPKGAPGAGVQPHTAVLCAHELTMAQTLKDVRVSPGACFSSPWPCLGKGCSHYMPLA